MYINRLLKSGLLFVVLAAVAATGCKRSASNSPANEDDNGGYAGDISRIEWASNDAVSLVDAAGFFYNGVYMRTATDNFGKCAVVATDTFSNPHVLTIRFGSSNCQCLDGRLRRGSIVVTYAGKFKDTGDVKTVSFEDYYINDQQLSGTIKLVRVDTIVTGNWYYKLKVDESLTSEKKIISWSGTLVRKWLSGYETGDRYDNSYSISGVAKMTRSNGHEFGCDIATPLQVNMDCDYIKTGVINVNADQGVRILNYGLGGTIKGDCDRNAQLNIGSQVYYITF